MNDASARRAARRWVRPVFQGAIYALGILPMLLAMGILITEGLPNMRPNILEPSTTSVERAHAESTGSPNMKLGRTIILYVRPMDRQRLVQTMEGDIDRHGGWTIRRDQKGRELTAAVPREYIGRLQPLISSSGISPPSTAYREWARMVHQQPHDPTITGPADTTVSIWIGVPMMTSRITPMLIWGLGVPSLAALLIALLCIPANMIAWRPAENSQTATVEG